MGKIESPHQIKHIISNPLLLSIEFIDSSLIAISTLLKWNMCLIHGFIRYALCYNFIRLLADLITGYVDNKSNYKYNNKYNNK